MLVATDYAFMEHKTLKNLASELSEVQVHEVLQKGTVLANILL